MIRHDKDIKDYYWYKHSMLSTYIN